MATNATPIATASINSGATLIYTDVSAGLGSAGAVKVQATTAILLLHPSGGFPKRPFLTGNPASAPDNGTYTVAAGAQFTTFAPEAAALIAAGAATLVADL